MLTFITVSVSGTHFHHTLPCPKNTFIGSQVSLFLAHSHPLQQRQDKGMSVGVDMVVCVGAGDGVGIGVGDSFGTNTEERNTGRLP